MIEVSLLIGREMCMILSPSSGFWRHLATAFARRHILELSYVWELTTKYRPVKLESFETVTIKVEIDVY
jgi:hypothetical protein